MDTDGDGKISESEFQEYMQGLASGDWRMEFELVDSIVRAWPNHPLSLEMAREAFLNNSEIGIGDLTIASGIGDIENREDRRSKFSV